MQFCGLPIASMTSRSVMSVSQENIPEYFERLSTFTRHEADASRSAFKGETPMKWMWSTALVVVAVSAAVSAQSGKDMSERKMGDKMNMTYTGCVEAVNHGGSFLLTHVAQMHDDHMMPSAVFLAGRSDLKKHVGQKVTVSGSLSHQMSEAMPNGRDTLAVASLKVVAKSCS
jgi:hypothetical protein